MESWRQPWTQDGKENRSHSPAFAQAVEEAMCQFQRKLIHGVIDDGDDVDAGLRRSSAWALERLFDAEFSRASSSARPQKPAR